MDGLVPPDEVKQIFEEHSENGQITAKNLHRFLTEVQGERDATEKDAEALLEAMRQHKIINVFNRHALNLEAFFRFLFSDYLNPALKSQVHHDMNAPLSHYFIFTGHNSYLTGNQLSSDCSDVPIIQALNRGVRVIELDIWPNSEKNDIHVLHGRTLTSPVALIKCLRSIKEHAFNASEYPVIITLEDHLTPELQAKTAKLITETFGKLLYTPESEDFFEKFPSPESLKGRVIISTKPPKEYLERRDSENNGKPDKKQQVPDESPWGDELDEQKGDSQRRVDSFVRSAESNLNGEQEEIMQSSAENDAPPEYKRIIAIRAGKPKGETLVGCLRIDDKHVKRVSLSEPQLEKVVGSHPAQVVRFTQKNLLRVYPKGTRITSSNYNPLVAWTHGAQMVALNMQGYGRSLWLVHGFFKANGGCGYIKKPDFLLQQGSDDNDVFNPKASRPIKTKLKIKIYMGDGWRQDFKKTHFDTYSPPDFYTRVGIAGVPADTLMKRTRAIEDRWIPCWNEEFEFPLTVPELALLRIEVHEYDMSEKDDFAGQTVLPVSELKTGFRAVPLCNRKGGKYDTVRLFVRITFES
eukprot:TRINITY_DN31554_c0_g1_i1.p1 TRINITY_DN31554_c0_g1~~TRINITY_DN31554_c0_g1_i1.p1  ORF type:complete len:611 (+),score=71.40 TRINITY_DN31554_c0_g1_i1:96-1835(+)